MIFKGVCARAVISNYDTLFNTGVLKVLLVRSQVEMRAHYWVLEKDNPCYKEAENLAELCSSVGWEVELMSDLFRH